MAMAVNHLSAIQGGWALVHRGKLVADVKLEIAGLMTARSAEALDAEMQAFYAEAAKLMVPQNTDAAGAATPAETNPDQVNDTDKTPDANPSPAPETPKD